MSGPLMAGLYGKLPAHGDFVRRVLPRSFVGRWDAWLAAVQSALEKSDAAEDWRRGWRFLLPAGLCGPDAVTGVLLPSRDAAERRFPLTLAMLLPVGSGPPPEEWFAALEQAGSAAAAAALDADSLLALLPLAVPGLIGAEGGQARWWTADMAGVPNGCRLTAGLPDPSAFASMIGAIP